MINTAEVYNKIIYFFKIAFINFGKEVTIPSNDFFVINQISDSEKETLGEYTSSSTDKIIPCCAVKRYIKTNPKI